MTLSKTDLTDGIDDVLGAAWDVRDGKVVPESDTVALGNGAMKLDATYLYADMAGSTELAQNHPPKIVAKVIRTYLHAASRIINACDGEIRSFDGDRVMGIFIGNAKNSNAARAALHINWAVEKVINPKLEAKWDALNWEMGHGIGIDTGEALLVRGGVRGDNDLISIGSAPNVAAKLSDIRDSHPVHITESVYGMLNEKSKYRREPDRTLTDMWETTHTVELAGETITVHGSWWNWSLPS
jgi:adenylate cyclase